MKQEASKNEARKGRKAETLMQRSSNPIAGN